MLEARGETWVGEVAGDGEHVESELQEAAVQAFLAGESGLTPWGLAASAWS